MFGLADETFPSHGCCWGIISGARQGEATKFIGLSEPEGLFIPPKGKIMVRMFAVSYSFKQHDLNISSVPSLLPLLGQK